MIPPINVGLKGEAKKESWVAPPTDQKFRVNLPELPESRLIFRDEHSMPQGSGLLFQFVDELCKFDRATVPTVINQLFYGCLGTDEEDAAEEFSTLVRSWGNLHNSDWANIITHIFKVIDISMRCQCEPIVMMTAGRYDGIFMRGGGFHVTIGGKQYRAFSQTEISAALPSMDYHGSALWNILLKLEFDSDETRTAAFRTCRSIKKLKEYIGALRLTGGLGVQESIKKEAKFLAFPEDKVLDPNAANIAFVLSFIADTSKDLNQLPYIHHSLLFSENRAHIAWSAFGEEAPSFKVPGGKTMFLNSQFTVTSARLKKEKGPKASRSVTKIGAHLVPLPLALQHLDACLAEKTIQNPFGNDVVNAAASHMNKVFDGASADMLIAAWRSACKVTVVSDDSKGKKRARDEDEAVPSKKGKVDYGF